MKRALLILIAAFLLLSASACSGGRERDNEAVDSDIYGGEDPASDNSSNDVTAINDLDGWWYLADGYPSEGVAMVTLFKLDAEAGTWTTYDEWDEEYYVDIAYLTDDGRLCLVFELGDTYFIIEDREILLDEETGETAFVMGWPPEASSPTGMDGKWYKNGDTSAAYYLFEGGTFKKLSIGVEPSSVSGKPYLLKEQAYYQPDGNLTAGTSIERDDPYETETFILSDDGTFFFIPYHNTFYMREDIIGTPGGDGIIRKYRLQSNNWGCWSDEGYERLELCDQDVFVLNRQVGMDVELKDSGTWSLEEDTLTLYFSDGGSEEFMLSEDTQSLAVERYGFTFTIDGE